MTTHPVENTNRIWSYLVAVGIFGFLALGVWQAFFQVTNTIGPIGMDKVGRQVFLQSFDDYFRRDNDSTVSGFAVSLSSEFSSVPFLQRLLQEPQRTTFKMTYHILDSSRTIDPTIGNRFLESSADELMGLFRDSVTLQDGLREAPDSVTARLHGMNVRTVRELLAAFGFRRVELIVNGRTFISDSLPRIGRGNVKWVGSD